MVQNKIATVRRQLSELESKKLLLENLLRQLEKQPAAQSNPPVSSPPSLVRPPLRWTDDNVRLFAALFRGREDVFPRRWKSQTGKSGYSPVCRNEWKRNVCPKPKGKCHDCLHKDYVPLTPDHIRQHLSGRMTIGVYPLLQNETCHFLAVDFDKSTWMEDVAAFTRVCNRHKITYAMERSRSGNGAHVWFFFERPLPARLARRFGCALLTETMDTRHQIGLDSYDRLFPSQDTMPKGQFGNLIALPLQAEPTRSCNSLFIDDQFTPYADQWAFLKTVRLLPETVVRAIKEDAARRGRILGVRAVINEDDEQPWNTPPSGHKQTPIIGPLPSKIEIVYSNMLFIPKATLPSGLINRLIRLAAIQNPEFYRAQAMQQSTFGKPRIISCAEMLEKYIALPRACLDDVTSLFIELGIRIVVSDKRCTGKLLHVQFRGMLSPEQEQAVKAICDYDLGVISAPPAFGKTVVGAKIIANRGVNTLILVCRQQLMDQWRQRLATFLDLPLESIGLIGGGKRKPTGLIDVAMIQSLIRQGTVADTVAEYGHVILDECHHGSAVTYDLVLRQVRAWYITGLTATPTRKDGHHPIIFMQCGPIRYALSGKQSAQHGLFAHRVVTRLTGTDTVGPEEQIQMQDIYTAIMNDENRTSLIVNDIRASIAEGKTPLVLTERREHLATLAERLAPVARHLIILHGNMGIKQLRAIMARLAAVPENESRILLSTGRYIGEGFDDSRLDCLFLTMPISWKGTLQQYAGRLHRLHHAKHEVVIYDYVDANIPIARRMFEKRKKGYAAMGYELEDSKSPAKMSLPDGPSLNL
ncbi:MAG: DEAD/DEAH box helicase [Verrucomicrobia bacterium]|nr:DEAD/DEAH box helicase [Verrucomicrobiota bacterium]MBU1855674.1 DEAD/DEAH box helicase [Verrucomicrobiota bacterium]